MIQLLTNKYSIHTWSVWLSHDTLHDMFYILMSYIHVFAWYSSGHLYIYIYIYISYSWLQWDFTYSNINRVFLVLLTGISGHICKCPTCRISFTSQVSVGDDTSKRSLGDVESIGHLPSPVYGLGMFGLSINSIFSTWWECLIETAIDKGFHIRTSIDRDCSIQTSIYRNVPINQHPFLEHILLKAPFTVDFPHVQIHCSLGSGDGTAIDHPWDLQWRSGQWLPATPLLVDD